MEYSTFQAYIDYIKTLVDAGSIKVMTFAEMYDYAFGAWDVQSKINNGTDLPDSKTSGDVYIRLQTAPAQNEVYLKISGTWTKIGSLNV